MQYLLTTLGCKVNQYESSVLAAEMRGLGFFPAEKIESADIFILNSCTVTQNSDKKNRRLLDAAKNKNPQVITVLTGCFPQAFPEEAKKLGADITVGVAKRKALPSLISEFIKDRKPIEKIMPVSALDVYEEFGGFNADSGRTRAFIKIQDGCDSNCAYCIVPRARGAPRSRPLENIKSEAHAAAKAGYKEIVLTGINLTKYGATPELNLCDAVNAVSEYAERVRLSSVEPDLLTNNILEKLSQTEKLCPHFHLSLQSGSDGVLRRMGRRYTAEEYYKKVMKIRELFKDGAFTTDIIVGFPGETEEELSQSLDFARKVNFSKIHVFPYSVRDGTPAASMENQVPESVKRERCKTMLSAADEMRQNFLTAQIGKTLRVLVEKRTSPESDIAFGHAENYAPIRILSQPAKRNDILDVKITDVGNGFCVGR